MQNLKERLLSLNFHSLKEWFARHPWAHQFILMLSQGVGACFVKEDKESENLKLEIAPCHLDNRGCPRREVVDGRETVINACDKETGRSYGLSDGAIVSPEKMEELFVAAEEAYEKENTGFRPAFLFDYVEDHAPKKKGGS